MLHALEGGLDPLSFADPEVDEQLNFSMSTVDNKPSGLTVQQALDDMFKVHYEGSLSERTAMVNCRVLSAHFGRSTDVNLALTDQAVESFIYELVERGNSNGTINRKLSLLRVLIKHCGDSVKNPPSNIKSLKEGQHRTRIVKTEEELVILDHFKEDPLMTLYIIMSLDTGMRQGELLAATVGDIDWKRSVIHVPFSKNGQPRYVPLSSRIIKLIAGLRLSYHKTPVLGTLTYCQIRSRWNRVKFEMGLRADDEFVPHSMRHTCATRLTKSGVQTDRIKLWLGHADIKTTLRYAHADIQDLLEVQSTLDNNLGPNLGLEVK